MSLSILEMLYIILIVFWSIIWTLLIIILLRVVKILWPIMEIVEFYNKIKSIFSAYASIPEKVKENIKDILKK